VRKRERKQEKGVEGKKKNSAKPEQHAIAFT
jgi:hypothetical protein